uniref:Helicase ATP-binding domain-containing protein n=1 Tax=viral metagenome TaxID=1070528 RepID=A0A6C0KPB6_9ZZZZ
MSFEIKLKKNKDFNEKKEICQLNKLYSKKCPNNKEQLNIELKNRIFLEENPEKNSFLYPLLDDPNFNIKIAQKKEFSDTKYDGSIFNVKDYAKILSNAEYELLPQQAFVKNFLSFQTPYNSLLLYHGLGSGKTCSAIGVCEEMRDYLKQMGINKRIIIVASPNVQDNFKLQLFDERKLKELDGIWTMKGCLGNKLLKEINPTGMKGLKKEKVIQQVKNLINSSYSFQGYLQFSNEIAKKSGELQDINIKTKIKNLQNEYSDRLIVIDEVHNIRISDDNENKNIAKNLMYLVSVVSNIRLLLLSATPMFNSYKEIVWLLNLMNMNDRRGIVSVSDIFDKSGDFKKDKDGNDLGKEMLIRKATGYISYVRGENPYTFPFRVFPNRFAPDFTFNNIDEYPKYQINGRKIPNNKKITKLSLYINTIGDYQQMGYSYIINRLRNREQITRITKSGKEKRTASFISLKSFGYTDLQLPIEALNIIYPYNGLEDLVKNIPSLEYLENEEEDIDDISPIIGNVQKEIIEEIDDVINNGPILDKSNRTYLKPNNSELESEPTLTEGLEADLKSINIKNNSSFSLEDSIETNNPKNEKNIKSFKESLFKKPDSLKMDGDHIIEGITESIYPENIKSKGGDNSDSNNDILFIDPKELTGSQGLKRIMNYVDSKTPSIKGDFEYKKGVVHVFKNNEIGKYSSKIKNVCNYIYDLKNDKVSDGIILVYSSYIDAGIIPMALALEEMGFQRTNKSLFKTPPTPAVDVRTMKPPASKKDFYPARYIMITGDPRISPNNDLDVKAITNDDNINGEKIKVVLISQAGSEGLDFKAIRQVHILDPWYNINRIEQIIGRAVRNFSHKDLPFEKRNVQIFLYGTILENAEEEAADLYVYRISEIKGVKIGKVSRVLKQTAVDCIINHDQTEFTTDNFLKIEENKDIYQVLSDHQKLENFQIGDMDNSPTCDFMSCEFKCYPDIKIEDSILNTDTYNETFMLINSDKIIQKIKSLMKMRFFYKKKDLIQLINIPKKYPITQIYAALTQIITDNTEYITDKYFRTGYLINIGEYYLFQPSELNYSNISIYDRSVPIDYKHDMIKFEIKNNIVKPVIDKRNVEEKIIDDIHVEGKKIIENMFENYNLAFETTKVKRGNDNWYQHSGVVIRKMAKESDIIKGGSEQERLEILEEFLIEHIVDSLMMNEKIDLLNYIYGNNNIEEINKSERLKRFFGKAKKYLLSKIIVSKGITGILIFNGPSRLENLNIYVLENKKWIEGGQEDKRDLEDVILKKYNLKKNMNDYVGFIGFETNKKYMVYKVKDTTNERSTGFRCDQSGKDKIIKLLNKIETNSKYESKITKDGAFELCVRQEFTLRSFQREKLENKTWFLDTESAIINEFEKKEKR